MTRAEAAALAPKNREMREPFMLHLDGPGARLCDGLTRREWLRVGGLGFAGLSLSDLLQTRTAASPGARAKSCIQLFMWGGPSQHETFDLKPNAPAGIRGEFRPIATNVPGIRICEHLPQLARQADKFCLIRSMTHPHPRHGWGLYYMLTGRRHNRPDLDAPPTPDDFPGLGALVTKLAGRRRPVPPAVTLPRW